MKLQKIGQPFLRKKILVQVSAVLLGATLSAGAAHSQVLEEVLVTAQKRAQGAQDIGLAVTAVTGESLREQGIDQADDLARIIPNVSVQNISGGGVPVVIVRGIGLQNFRINDTPTTAFYIDEVYQTSIVSAEFTMFDLERVEVLKGPQGGLYGRNTIAGAVQVISQRPEIGESDGYLKLGYGQFDKTQIEAASSIPISDTLAARVSLRSVRSDDTSFRSIPGGFDHGEEDRQAGRFLLRYQPDDETDILLKLTAGEDESDLPLLRTVGSTNAGFGSGICPSVLSGQGPDSATCATHELNAVTPQALGLGDSDDDRFDSAATGAAFLDNEWYGISLNASFELGDYTLVSISAYDEIDYRRNHDIDAVPAEFQEIDYRTEIEAWSQELRLFYNGSDVYNWVVGINYAEDDLSEDTDLFGADSIFLFVPTAEVAPQAYEQEAEALAVYGRAEWHFSDNWNLVGELRYTNEDRSFAGSTDALLGNGDLQTFASNDDEVTFEAVSGKIGLEWTVQEDVLLYGNYSRGFKTGGFFGGFALQDAELEPYDEETIDAYEFGVKSDWLEGSLRANGSVFYYDRKDIQASALSSNDFTDINRLQNVGDADTKGAELDLTWLPTGSLTLQLSLGYTDAEITDSDFVQNNVFGGSGDGGGGFSLEGANLPNYSKFSGNFIGRYEQPIGELRGSIQLEYSYRSERDLSLIVDPALEDAFLEDPSYELINLRLGLASDDTWSVQAFVENIADEDYRLLARNDGLFGLHELFGPERTWGLSYTYNWQ